jgi:hypothetical protein
MKMDIFSRKRRVLSIMMMKIFLSPKLISFFLDLFSKMTCFEHILLKYSKGLGTGSGNLLVPLPTLFTICHAIYQTVSCKH